MIRAPLSAARASASASPGAVLGAAAMLVVFSYVFLANSWVSDDAYISFRVVDNVVHGFGLTYNPPERVQVYTHPLWLLLHVAGYLISGEVFYTTLVISFACTIASLVICARHLGVGLRSAAFAALVLSSKAFVDYTSSGLENPLSYLLLAIFFTRFLADVDAVRPPPLRHVTWYTFIAALGFVNRPDTILLFGPAVLWLAIAAGRESGRKVWKALVIGAAPAIAWEVFSVVYYGFPLPNTYYAKVATGIPAPLLVGQGLAYVLNSLAYDALTLSVVGLAMVLAALSGRAPKMAIAAGLVLAMVYTVRVGGDHMGGRFFAAPFLVAALFVAASVRDHIASWTMIAALALYNVAMPLVPLKAGPGYEQGWAWRETNGIQDERGYYHRATNLLLYNPLTDRPDHEWYRQGLSFGRSAERVSIQGSIGFFGYTAGPHKYVVDPNALSDPLLARLPASDNVYFDFYVGHFSRDIPDGYVASCAQGQNLLRDPLLRDLYDRVLNVTRGPLFSGSRLRDIWALNVGRFRRVHELFNASRESRVVIRATNPRLRTDVGVRDYERLEIRSRGERPGYVVYGPSTPLRRGRYRVRWIGRYDEAPPTAEVGFVEVWADGREIGRRGVRSEELDPGDRGLAEIDFELPESVLRAEFRLFAHFGAKISLERLEIESTPFGSPGEGSGTSHRLPARLDWFVR